MSNIYIIALTVCLLSEPISSFNIVINKQGRRDYQDQKGNVTDAELTKIKSLISTAQSQYNATDYNKIAKLIYQGLKGNDSYTWSVYVYHDKINRIAIGVVKLIQNKYIWMMNYGKYNFTYVLYKLWLCHTVDEFGGGGSAPFGQDITPAQQDKIRQIVNDSIIYRGDNMDSAALYIANKTEYAMGFGYWNTVIAEPTTDYGYFICRNKEFWAALRGYGQFKWNYYISMW